jgi:cytoplasmic iron level regulating protein YaaA (DUF328/UPF0246 family)
MLILLPPSEGKHSPEKGSALKLGTLSFVGELDGIRKKLLASIETHRCMPAHQIYTGVLYQALDYVTLPSAAKKRAEKSVVVISSLFGVLRLHDLIPTYRMKISTSVWKKAITKELEALGSNLIVDCRSSTYVGVWIPDHRKTVAVRVFQMKSGKKSVITHMSKKYRGELTRYLLLESQVPKSPEEVLRIARKHFAAELISATEKYPFYLDLFIHA